MYSSAKAFCVLLAFQLVLLHNLSGQTPCENGMAGTYPCSNVDLLSYLPLSAIGGAQNTNDIWGWKSPNTGNEYALVGCSNGTAFLNVTSPLAPVYLGLLPTHNTPNLWRDLETYQNYCFIVSEAPDHGMQIFNLLQLDAVINPPVTFQETAHYGLFGHCHTLNINTESGFCYANGTNTFDGGLHIVNIQDPLNPTLAGGYAGAGYTHDCYAWTYDGPDVSKQGREIVFACNGDELAIVDCTDKSDCFALGLYTYPNLGYVHQGWPTKDKRFFLVNDELDEVNLGNDQIPYGTRTHIFDCLTLSDAEYVGYFENSTTAIDHNFYVQDHFVYQSNYRSGVRILDAVRIGDGQLTEVGFFDLFPLNNFAAFSGTWSNYPFLPSGINIATSMYDGVFITQPNVLRLTQTKWDLCGVSTIYLDLIANGALAYPLTPSLSNLPGVTIQNLSISEEGNYQIQLSGLNNLASGTYSATLNLLTGFGEKYELPFQLTVSANSPAPPVLQSVANGSQLGWNQMPYVFAWQAVNNATGYVFQLSADANFNTLVEQQNVVSNSYTLAFNLPLGTYFWRVRSSNECGLGSWSQVFSFQSVVTSVESIATPDFGMYPNPVQSNLSIQLYRELYVPLVISDISGRTILTLSPEPGKKSYTLNVEQLPAGLYFIKGKHTTLKFMKL